MNLNIGIIQSDIDWENIDSNLLRFEKHLDKLSEDTDVAVLPEMFATAFSMNANNVTVDLDSKVIKWIISQSSKRNHAIVAGVAIKETINTETHYSNCLIWVEPNKDILVYRKRHLFRMAGENKHYTKGDEKCIINYKGWRIRPFVCYDLRFPVWSRNVIYNQYQTPDYEYDCAIYIANWPKSRRQHWSSLLKARAIENQAYIVGVNRIGTDIKGYEYSGDSAVIDSLGKDISCITTESEICVNITLDKNELDTYRKKFPFILDADVFEIK